MSNVLSPIFSSKLGLFVYAVIFGLSSSDYALLKAGISRSLGNEWFGCAFSWLLLFEGMGIIVGPIIAGSHFSTHD